MQNQREINICKQRLIADVFAVDMCNHKICIINLMRCLRNSTARREIGQLSISFLKILGAENNPLRSSIISYSRRELRARES